MCCARSGIGLRNTAHRILHDAKASIIRFQVGVVADPISEVDIVCACIEGNVFWKMAVPEDKVINFRLFLQDIPRMLQKEFLLPMVNGVEVPGFAAAALRKEVSKANAKVGVEAVESPLAKAVPENRLDEFIPTVARPKPIAVVQVACAPMDHAQYRRMHDLGTKLFCEIIAQPHVMVPGKVVDHNALVVQFCEFAQDAHIAFGHSLAVFKPKVEDIAQQIEFLGIGRDQVEPLHKMFFPRQARRVVGRTEVEVGSEICFVAQGQSVGLMQI